MSEYIKLINDRTKVIKEINEYLDKYSELMDDCLNTDPIWKPYNEMLNTYAELEDKIRTYNYVQNTK